MQEKPDLSFGDWRTLRRTTVRLAKEELIKTSFLNSGEEFPLVLEPNIDHFNLVDWLSTNREFVQALLLKYGALLFRGFDIRSVDQFERVAKSISPDLLDYHERAAPRTEVASRIYTSTEYPSTESLPLHHEMSYSHNWPQKIFFFCEKAAKKGGRTPIANDRRIYDIIPHEIKQLFLEKKVMYIRNFGEGVDLPWQEAFQTNDGAAVEVYCRKARVEFEWIDRNRLRTRQVRQAVATHPETNETVWFNHAHMFHVSNLKPAVRDMLLSQFNDDELPRNAFYGDGSRIEAAVLDEIRELYSREAVSFPWQEGDILLLDNFLASHGREPYDGPRSILVAMAELFTNDPE